MLHNEDKMAIITFSCFVNCVNIARFFTGDFHVEEERREADRRAGGEVGREAGGGAG